MPITRQTAEKLMDTLPKVSGDLYENILKTIAKALGDHRFDQEDKIIYITARTPLEKYLRRNILRRCERWTPEKEAEYIQVLRDGLNR